MDNPFKRPEPSELNSYPAYLYFVAERELVRHRKESGAPGPWTDDPVLQQYRFTNVRRRDDRMTKWFIEHLIKPNETSRGLWFTLLIARIVNWPPTLHELLLSRALPCTPQTFDPKLFIATMQWCVEQHKKAYGDAYMIYPAGRGQAKSVSIAHNVLMDAATRVAPLVEDAIFLPSPGRPSVADVVGQLAKTYGVSTFIAGQVAADLTYCSQLSGASDLYTYAPIGPGSQRGLSILHDRPLTHKWMQHDFNNHLEEANYALHRELDMPDLTLHCVQNTFCEYSKYAKAVRGSGRPRNIYKPQTAY